MKSKSKKVRNAVNLQMILTRKGGPMKDRKKESVRQACRKPVDKEED